MLLCHTCYASSATATKVCRFRCFLLAIFCVVAWMRITLSLYCWCWCCCYCFRFVVVICRDFIFTHANSFVDGSTVNETRKQSDTAEKASRRTKIHRRTYKQTDGHTNRQRLMAEVTYVTSASIYISHILCAARASVHCCTIYLPHILVSSAHKAPSLIKPRYQLLHVHNKNINRYTLALWLFYCIVVVVVATIFILHSALAPPIHLFGRQSLDIQAVGRTRATAERQRKWMNAAVAVRVTQKCNLNRKSM